MKKQKSSSNSGSWTWPTVCVVCGFVLFLFFLSDHYPLKDNILRVFQYLWDVVSSHKGA